VSPAPCFRFAAFELDVGNRRLLRHGEAIALNARYFDALALLLREHGQLVSKQRFFEEVWADTVVTDAALTQCIKDIRRQLGDDAASPRFIRTVPGHGYCFIAPVHDASTAAEAGSDAMQPTSASAVQLPAPPNGHPAPTAGSRSGLASGAPRWMVDGSAATLGGATAGLVGGLLYGSALSVSPQAQSLGTLSVLLVLVALNVLVGALGALGVGFGLAGARLLGRAAGWTLAGGALGGLAVGGLAKLLGSDAFTLLVGHAPSGITGGLEGAVIGFAVAAGLLLGDAVEAPRLRRAAAWGAATTGFAGAMITLAGGSMMATSLVRVAAAFDTSRLDMAPLGRLFGEPQFGSVAQAALGALEGGIFGGCVVAAMVLARGGRRRFRAEHRPRAK
jgi:DNA-binding winged helix-turn-helix (wHTH) protein